MAKCEHSDPACKSCAQTLRENPPAAVAEVTPEVQDEPPASDPVPDQRGGRIKRR